MVRSSSNSRESQKWALLIGVNEYPKLPSQYHLHGCVNDVAAIEELLNSRFAFPPANILKLTSPAADPAQLATRANILAAFEQHLIGNTRIRKDDVVIIYYSGHGSQIPDEDGDEEDGFDETIVPCDCGDRSVRSEVRDISDDEISRLLEQLAQRTQNINLVFDSCHSGTITRGLMDAESGDALGKERYLPPATYPVTPVTRVAVTRSMGPSGWMPLDKGYVLLSACMSHERAREAGFGFWGRKQHGVMTYYLLQAMKDVGPETCYFDIWDQLKINVTKHNRWQNPQIEGASERKVFGGSATPRKRYAEVASVSAEGVVIAAGLANGAASGSTFAIFRSGANEFADLSKRLAEVRLLNVDAFSALGEIEAGLAADIQPGCPAIELEHNYGDQRMPVRVVDPNSELSEVRRQIELSQLLKLAGAEGEPAITTVILRFALDEAGNQITAAGRKLFVLSAGDGHPLVEPLAWDEESAALVKKKLEHIASFHNVLAIHNPDDQSELKNKITLQLLRVTLEQDGISDKVFPIERGPGGDLILKVGDKVIVEVANESDQMLHLVILDCDTSWGITPVFPPAGAADTGIAPNTRRRTNRFTVDLPNHQKPVKPRQPLPREVLKVIATTEPIEFRALWQDSVRSVSRVGQREKSPALLLESAMGLNMRRTTRTLVTNRDQGIKDWTTAELVFHITT